MTAPALGATAPGAGWLRVTMLDVGQGEAISCSFPSGQSLLVDAGGTPGPFDIGGRVVTPALWALGVRRLDWLASRTPTSITSAAPGGHGGPRAARDLGGRAGAAQTASCRRFAS